MGIPFNKCCDCGCSCCGGWLFCLRLLKKIIKVYPHTFLGVGFFRNRLKLSSHENAMHQMEEQPNYSPIASIFIPLCDSQS